MSGGGGGVEMVIERERTEGTLKANRVDLEGQTMQIYIGINCYEVSQQDSPKKGYGFFEGISLLKGLIIFLEEYKISGFEIAKSEAENIALELEVEPIFRETRIRHRKRFFDENSRDEPIQGAEECFRSKLKEEEDESLKNSCAALEKFLKHKDAYDINALELFSELQLLRKALPDWITKPLEVLEYVKNLHHGFPNAWIAYRILLTIPVTVASAERSFFKLKLIKNYLQSTMSQDRLNGLAILSIEKKMVANLDYDDLVNNFAQQKARRV
ncbi:uncharacterized protein [Henckelia pumila]|uniref:uncharacterized protein n=1 Tax=Henckelia pumila TaxID=405737 RepID=UPI003C6DF1D8